MTKYTVWCDSEREVTEALRDWKASGYKVIADAYWNILLVNGDKELTIKRDF